MLAGITVPASGALADRPHEPTANHGGIGVRLVGTPVGLHDARPSSWIVERLAPGTSARRRVEIINSSSSTQNIVIYTAAASSQQGTFAFARGHVRNELSSWTSVSHNVLRLAAGASMFETVTINVPQNASFGERVAVVWAELSAPSDGGITLVNRVGVRMYVTIGTGGAPAANFAIGALIAKRSAAGEPLVIASVHNSGQGSLDISGTLTLENGPAGLLARPTPVTLTTALASGDTDLLTIRLDKQLPRGRWRTRLQLTSGLLQRTAVATITFPKATPARFLHVKRTEILLGLLAITAFMLLLLRAQRRHTPRPEIPTSRDSGRTRTFT